MLIELIPQTEPGKTAGAARGLLGSLNLVVKIIDFTDFHPILRVYIIWGWGSSDYYRAYLEDIIWSISLILCNKIYARVEQN